MKLGLLCFGRYRNALIEGGLATGSFKERDLLIFDAQKAKVRSYILKHPLCRSVDEKTLLRHADVIIVGHITEHLEQLLAQTDSATIFALRKKVFISIDALLSYSNPHNYKIIHILNNYATRVNKGVIGVHLPGPLAKDKTLKKLFVKLFGKTGLLVFVDHLKDLLRVRMAAGSGIGLLSFFCLELQKASGAYLPDKKIRERLIKEAFLGVAELVKSGMSFEDLLKIVKTSGGPTENFIVHLKKMKIGAKLRESGHRFFRHKYLYDN